MTTTFLPLPAELPTAATSVGFPVQHATIVGTDLRLVETVTGRMTTARGATTAAAAHAATRGRRDFASRRHLAAARHHLTVATRAHRAAVAATHLTHPLTRPPRAHRGRTVMTLARPHTAHVAGRTPGSGPVLAVLTDGPTDMAVAAHAADLAARTRTLLVAAATVHTTGISVNALPHQARTRRVNADSTAIVARVTPILHTAGVAFVRTTVLVPAGTDTLRALPLGAVHELVGRFGAVAVVTALPLHDPTGVLHPAQPHHTGAHGGRHATGPPTTADITRTRTPSLTPW